MARVRQSRVELAPLLDVVFIVLLLYIVALVGKADTGQQDIEEKEEEMIKQQRELEERMVVKNREIYDLRRELNESRDDLVRERMKVVHAEATADETKAALEELQIDKETLQKLLSRIQENADRVVENTVILDLIERAFDVVEVTFRPDRKMTVVYEGKTHEVRVRNRGEIIAAIESKIDPNYDPAKTVFLIRSTHQSWILAQVDFNPLAREKKWIFNATPVTVALPGEEGDD